MVYVKALSSSSVQEECYCPCEILEEFPLLVIFLSLAWEWSALMVHLILVGSVKGAVRVEWGKSKVSVD